jgi:hypothetical protein
MGEKNYPVELTITMTKAKFYLVLIHLLNVILTTNSPLDFQQLLKFKAARDKTFTDMTQAAEDKYMHCISYPLIFCKHTNSCLRIDE